MMILLLRHYFIETVCIIKLFQYCGQVRPFFFILLIESQEEEMALFAVS